ncbi:hypothetical protein BXZ70DRAFT_314304 [Cristinia sonorae]|uniref:Uncharacterized protein n=1 Tax=Cristinia sonorae TaxID=1940300 RepID=A0A8K0UL57_9AGAR|nr:hypothetical protein BXZ70DRAFT_314304 [Cristinia sonorae]
MIIAQQPLKTMAEIRNGSFSFVEANCGTRLAATSLPEWLTQPRRKTTNANAEFWRECSSVYISKSRRHCHRPGVSSIDAFVHSQSYISLTLSCRHYYGIASASSLSLFVICVLGFRLLRFLRVQFHTRAPCAAICFLFLAQAVCSLILPPAD